MGSSTPVRPNVRCSMEEACPGVRGQRRTVASMSELLPEQTSDDTDAGWGEAADSDDDERRLLAEKPPHHLESP
jgi:hypothetical protein